MIEELGQQAKKAAREMAKASTAKKNEVLLTLITMLETEEDSILSANQFDIDDAESRGLGTAMIDRLSLQGRLTGIAGDIERVEQLPDPIGEKFDAHSLPNGLTVCKQRVPIGVLGVIYEARPNVTLDIAALAIKTGNCVILRGSSETLRSNLELVRIIRNALIQVGLPATAIQFIDDPNRDLVKELLHLHDYVDLIIPRGGAKLHQFCRENSTIPVITGGIGVCHLYVDQSADLEKSVEVIFNAKTQRPTVCNALDTVIMHHDIASAFLPMVLHKLNEVSFRFDQKSWDLLDEEQKKLGQLAQQDDWNTEWLDLVLGVKIVDDLDEAIEHICDHSTNHSDGILTNNEERAQRFVNEIDSSTVYVNASTRFTDGSQLGLGAEVAISTQKLHARGAMGLKEITTYKWVVEGNYTVRS